jgi:hypothetical protein
MKRTAIALGTACMLVLLGCGGAIASPRGSASSSEISARFTHLRDLNALNAPYQRQGTLRFYHDVLELEALARSAAAGAGRYPPPRITGIHRPRTSVPSGTKVVTATAGSSSAFDWTEAGIGAAGGSVLALVLTAGLLVLFRAHSSSPL